MDITKNETMENGVTNNVNEITASNYDAIIKQVLVAGGKRINNVRIKNINFTDKDNYTMVSFTLASPIRGFVSDDEGVTYKEGMTNTIFTSLYAICGAIKEDEELSWMSNTLLEKPNILNLLLNGSKIDILQQDVATGEEYKNPFSTNTSAESQVFDHDVIINNVIKFKLGKIGQVMANKLADKLLGF